MTDGTSQGLFIVVAIVIFGIFVVLAYILFEDTLSPALANMFTDATEQADSRLDSNEGMLGDGINLISIEDIEVNNIEYGNNVNYVNFVRSKGFIPVKSNTYYTLSLNSPWKFAGSFWEYSEDKELTGNLDSWKRGVKHLTIRTGEDTKFLRFRARDALRGTHPLEEWELKLEVGRRPTQYSLAPDENTYE